MSCWIERLRGRGGLGEVGLHAFEECMHGAGHALECLLSGIEPCQAQEVANEPFHPQRVARDGFEKAARLFRIRDSVEQRFDVAPHGGERRPELVRDVGDEVAADLVGAPQVRDVVQHQDGTARRARGDRRTPRNEDRPRLLRQRQLPPLGRGAGQGGADLGRDLGMAHDLQVMLLPLGHDQPQHPLRSGVRKLEPAVFVDHEHAFDHAAEDRLHAGAVGREFCCPAADLADGVVEHARHDADFIAAWIAHAAGQITGCVSPRRGGNRSHPSCQEGGADPCECEGEHDP